MSRMVTLRLQNSNLLKKCNQTAILHSRLVRPFVSLVGVRGQHREQPNLPGQHIEPPAADNNQGRHCHQVPRASPPASLNERARFEVMLNICFSNPSSDKWRISANIGILGPMNNSAYKVRQEDDANGFKNVFRHQMIQSQNKNSKQHASPVRGGWPLQLWIDAPIIDQGVCMQCQSLRNPVRVPKRQRTIKKIRNE